VGQDDPASDEYNVPSRVNDFVGAAKTWVSQLAGGDVMFMMGTGARGFCGACWGV